MSTSRERENNVKRLRNACVGKSPKAVVKLLIAAVAEYEEDIARYQQEIEQLKVQLNSREF